MGFQGHANGAVEAQLAFGFLYVSTPANTAIATGGTYVKIAGTTTPLTLIDFTHTDNRLTYSGVETRLFSVDVSVTMTGSNAVVGHIRVAKNGTTVAESEQQRYIAVGTDVGNASIHAEVELASGDYIEIFWTTGAGEDTKNLQAEKMTVTVE